MDVFSFFKKKKNTDQTPTDRKLICDVCLSHVNDSSLYCLTTTQVFKSKDFWDFLLLRSDIYLYTKAMFVDKNIQATHYVHNIIKGLVSSTTPWAVCPKCISMFDVDLKLAREFAVKKSLDPNFKPPNSGCPNEIMNREEFDKMLNWVLWGAGMKAFV